MRTDFIVKSLLNLDFDAIYNQVGSYISSHDKNPIFHHLIVEPEFKNLSLEQMKKIFDFSKRFKQNFSKTNKEGLTASQLALNLGLIDFSNILKEYETPLISNVPPFPKPSNSKDPVRTQEFEELENLFIEACIDKKIRYYGTISALKKFYTDELYFYNHYLMYAFRYNHIEMAKDFIEMIDEAKYSTLRIVLKRKSIHHGK